MFIKIPVYFEVEGSFRNLGLLQESLQLFLEHELLGRETSKVVNMNLKKVFGEEIGDIRKILLIKRDRVIDGLR